MQDGIAQVLHIDLLLLHVVWCNYRSCYSSWIIVGYRPFSLPPPHPQPHFLLTYQYIYVLGPKRPYLLLFFCQHWIIFYVHFFTQVKSMLGKSFSQMKQSLLRWGILISCFVNFLCVYKSLKKNCNNRTRAVKGAIRLINEYFEGNRYSYQNVDSFSGEWGRCGHRRGKVMKQL